MLTARDIHKSYDGRREVLKGVSITVPTGSVVGLIGENGAGKSTLLRILSRVYRADSGTVTYWEEEGTPLTGADSVLVADELYFLPGANIRRMARLYAAIYPRFDGEWLKEQCRLFGLDMKKNIRTFSKGMKRQAALLTALACNTPYLFIDETFDGIDPVKREHIRKLLCTRVKEKGLTAVISGHSLRELEGTCDRIVLLWNGTLVREDSQSAFHTAAHKYQAVFTAPAEADVEEFMPLHVTREGSVTRFVSCLEPKEVLPALLKAGALVAEELPLKLEELFLYGQTKDDADPAGEQDGAYAYEDQEDIPDGEGDELE